MKRWILVIADDLTGALEAGAKFAAHNLAARVTTDIHLSAAPEDPVLVIDTESRHLPPAKAAARIGQIATSAVRFSPWLIYQKTDSTLRGNIAAEFAALQDVFPSRPLVYAPAYPEMGRTVKEGRLFVWGKPVHETDFAIDALNPVSGNDIRALLNGIHPVILDGESAADTRAAARLILAAEEPPLAAGPAALAGALAECLSSPKAQIPAWPSLSRCLVVNGSLHPASLAQISFARERGYFDDGNWQYFSQDIEGSGVERARRMGELVRCSLESSAVEAIIVFGGDTALGIHSALDAPPFEPYGEIVPGVPLARCGNLFWMTKAGGFGAPDILSHIRKQLL